MFSHNDYYSLKNLCRFLIHVFHIYLLIILLLFNYCFLANRVCGNDFTQHIPLRKPRRSQNKLKPIPDYHPD